MRISKQEIRDTIIGKLHSTEFQEEILADIAIEYPDYHDDEEDCNLINEVCMEFLAPQQEVQRAKRNET